MYVCDVCIKWIEYPAMIGRPIFSLRSSHTKDPKKCVLDAALLNTQHYKIRIKGKVEQSWGMKTHPSLHLGSLRVALDNSRQLLYINILRKIKRERERERKKKGVVGFLKIIFNTFMINK